MYSDKKHTFGIAIVIEAINAIDRIATLFIECSYE